MTVRLLFFSLFSASMAFGQQQPSQPLRHFRQAEASAVGSIPYGANPNAGRYATSDDAKIYYEVYGKGTPIVVLHGGLFGSIYEMHQLIDSLKKSHQVIAVSTRGHGKTELGRVPLTYEQRARDVMAVVNAVTRDSVTVLGFSDGGYTAYKLAATYPEKIRKIIVMGASELQPGMRTIHLTVKQAMSLDSSYWQQQLALMPQPQRLQEMFDQVADSYNQLTIGKDLLGQIKCPALIMAGDRDETVTVQRVVNAAQLIPQGALSIIPNCSHPVFLENFPAVWASIVPFITPKKRLP